MEVNNWADIAIVALLIYFLVPVLRSSGGMRIVWTVCALVVIYWLTDVFKFYLLNYILGIIWSVGIIAVVILFQPEIRRMLDHLGKVKLTRFLGMQKPTEEMVPIIQQTVMACEVMSRERVGALMVFARDNSLDEYFKTGTMIEAKVSEQLIRNIFFPKAALHDGAMIIRDGKIAAAGCVLPLSDSHSLSADLGTRHRAGVGMSEASDAVVVIVSEETGTISVAVGGVLKRYLAPQTLERLLRNELCKAPAQKPQREVLWQKRHKNAGGERDEQ
ncbi:MAG: diadenylate cyclase CdaA [Oscillospiraceae bacterium]|nr:diadenylate cyclase CdaA [Oscillospiraceae bacterium]